jgi:hypothetical protein
MLPQLAANTSHDKETDMRSRILSLLIASLFATSSIICAQDSETYKMSGSIGAEGLGASINARSGEKASEYRDLSDSPFGVFDVQLRSFRFFLDGYGENLGRDTMYLSFRGGMYDRFKYNVHGDWLAHNFGFGPNGARTPYSDPGSKNLVLFSTNPSELANSSITPWSSFNFRTKRRDIGGSFEVSPGSPWYFLLDSNQVHQSGIDKADAAALGTSPGNGFMDLPYPVDYTTYNVLVEGGYQTKQGHLSVNVLQSSFSNDHTLLHFQNPFFGFGADTATFAPNNYYIRVGINGMMRKLFWNSTLSGRIALDRLSDDQNMIKEVLNTSGSAALTSTNPSHPTFKGKAKNITAQFSLASSPMRHLDTRVYYKIYRRTNESTDIAFQVPLTTTGLTCLEPGTTSSASVAVSCEGERYGYTKHNPGIEAGYRITSDNRMSAGFDFLHTKRNRFDADVTRESKVFVQWSNTSFDSLTARMKYQFMERRSDFLLNNEGFDANSPFFLERYNRSFDVANLNQHLVKAYADWSPVKFLDFGFEAYYKKNKFKDIALGRLNDRRKEFYGSISYGSPSKFRATLFGDVEYIKYDSFHRTVNAATCPGNAQNCFNPSVAATRTAFNWASQLKDKNWTMEFGVEWPLRPKVVFKGSALVQETRGAVDFQSETLSDGTVAALLFPITAYDNTRRTSVHPRIEYLVARNAELTLGYSYEKYNYRDDQYNGYQYTVGTGTTTSYLSGIYAFPEYKAHILYGTVRYTFNNQK